MERPLGGTEYSVAFDPLDGSSIVDANFSVGTILGIWPGAGLVGRTGGEQVAALIALYGPRTTVALALNSSAAVSGTRVCMELTMHPHGWVATREALTIAPKAKIFAPGNLRATFDNAPVSLYLVAGFAILTCAYGSTVGWWTTGSARDIHFDTQEVWCLTCTTSSSKAMELSAMLRHLLRKYAVLFYYRPRSHACAAKAKLRLLFECAPIALIVEAAGGATCVSSSEMGEPIAPVSVLLVRITDLDKRIGICVGSTEEVERYRNMLADDDIM
jgi:sedoheptulose-bisphosphatase